MFFLFFFFLLFKQSRNVWQSFCLFFFTCTYLKVVKRKKGLRLSSLLLNVLNTVSASLFRVNNDGIHVFAQHFSNSNLILLLSGLTQVDQTSILKKGRVRRIITDVSFRQAGVTHWLNAAGQQQRFPHHRAGVQSLNTLHDLGLALLATVLLSVDSSISQLLHYLQAKANNNRIGY